LRRRARLLALAGATGLALALAGCVSPPGGVTPVRGFDSARYLGEWHAIMRLDHAFERGLTNVSAVYTAQGAGALRVVNRGFDRATCRWRSVEGRAAFLESPDVASLSVSFFWPISGGYHVIALDPAYGWAMVAGPTRDYLWILARKPSLPSAVRERLVEQARALGFPVEKLTLVDHSAPVCRAAS
jgi:apolipoprotein D and lipocalin family protein